MDVFETAVISALAQNGGKLNWEQAVALIDPAVKHRIMNYLVAMRNAGKIVLGHERVDGQLRVIVTSPVAVAPQPATPTPQPPVGGGS